MRKFKKTERYQFFKRIGHKCYCIVDVWDYYINGIYTCFVCKDYILLDDWLINGNRYSEKCKELILDNYESIAEFELEYPEKDKRRLRLAQLIFEDTPLEKMYEFEAMPEAETTSEAKIQKYLQTFLD